MKKTLTYYESGFYHERGHITITDDLVNSINDRLRSEVQGAPPKIELEDIVKALTGKITEEKHYTDVWGDEWNLYDFISDFLSDNLYRLKEVEDTEYDINYSEWSE